MAYQQIFVTSIMDIPAVVATFAAQNGWTVSGQKFRHGSGVEFTLAAQINGFDHQLFWSSTDPRVTSKAYIQSPKLKGTEAVPDVSIPSSVHLFADMDPEPHLVIVVEYGFNSYRHLYLGYLEKFGFENGGEVISATGFPSSSNRFFYGVHWRSDLVQFLFSAHGHLFGENDTGGVLVDHPNNPIKWRRFYGATGVEPNRFHSGNEAIGGFKDDINDGYLVRGRNSAAGINLLVPNNLYATIGTGLAAQFVPIGAPAGIRMVNMTDLDPKAIVPIGTDEWMVFPAICKGGEYANWSPGGWGLEETSFILGYAYRKN